MQALELMRTLNPELMGRDSPTGNGYRAAMALAPTLYNFQLSLNHVDRGVEQQVALKVARHPSETMERAWLRVLAYCWQWEDRLEFSPGGLSDPDTPDLWTHDLTGVVTRWIRVGKQDPARIQKEVDRNARAKVVVLFESPDQLSDFVEAARRAGTARVAKAELAAIDPELLAQLGAFEERRATLTVTFVGDHFYLECNGTSIDGPLTRAALS